jgi:response regulator of citrate/malate metabolism
MSSVVDWVLLVDDDEIQNFIHQRIIRKYVSENRIFVATNGQEALKMLHELIENKSNLNRGIIFLDINMPIMNGFQFLELYQNKFSDLFYNTILYPLSSSDDIKDIIQMNELGIESYIVKPLTHEFATSLFT